MYNIYLTFRTTVLSLYTFSIRCQKYQKLFIFFIYIYVLKLTKKNNSWVTKKKLKKKLCLDSNSIIFSKMFVQSITKKFWGPSDIMITFFNGHLAFCNSQIKYCHHKIHINKDKSKFKVQNLAIEQWMAFCDHLGIILKFLGGYLFYFLWLGKSFAFRDQWLPGNFSELLSSILCFLGCHFFFNTYFT